VSRRGRQEQGREGVPDRGDAHDGEHRDGQQGADAPAANHLGAPEDVLDGVADRRFLLRQGFDEHVRHGVGTSSRSARTPAAS
jgi:hypothetical protein